MEVKIIAMLDVTPRLENLVKEAMSVIRTQNDWCSPLENKASQAPEGKVVFNPCHAIIPPEQQAPASSVPDPEPAPEPEKTPDPEPAPAPEKQPESAPEQLAATQSETMSPSQATTSMEPQSTIPDDETMRTLLDIVISKWVGAGSENSKDPQTLRMRKDLCNAFKQIARQLGADKPTKLQGNARNKFLYEIENNLYCENGRIDWRPF